MPGIFRFFVNYPTDEDGLPNLGDPGYFRVLEASDWSGLPSGRPVEFWTGTEWKPLALQPFARHLDDVLRNGSTIREILDVRELPRG